MMMVLIHICSGATSVCLQHTDQVSIVFVYNISLRVICTHNVGSSETTLSWGVTVDLETAEGYRPSFSVWQAVRGPVKRFVHMCYFVFTMIIKIFFSIMFTL